MVTGGHKTSRQFNKMMRARMMDSDGFTYVYGAVKDGSTVRPASNRTKSCIRADKRKVRSKELEQVYKDYYGLND